MRLIKKVLEPPPISVAHPFSFSAFVAVSLLILSSAYTLAQTPAPTKTWIDPDTQHRVIRLSDEPGSKTLYFNHNAYTPDGKQMVYWAPQGIFVLDLTSFTTRKLVAGQIYWNVAVGTMTPTVYFMKVGDQHLYSVNVNSGYVLQLAELPGHAIVLGSVNADETLIAGTYLEGGSLSLHELAQKAEVENLPDGASSTTSLIDRQRHVKSVAGAQRTAAHSPETLFTYNLQTGAIKTIVNGSDWLNHALFSPVDPTLIMYCHEGHASDIDRIWTVRTDGTQNKLMYKTAPGEYVLHEFWSKDGLTIWYELQKKGTAGATYLVGHNLLTGTLRRHVLNLESRHYNGAIGDRMFIAEGSDHYGAAQWMSIAHPQLNSEPPSTENPIETGGITWEKLVNMSKHDYRYDPNARFSPDEKWAIFTSSTLGQNYLFAVEIAQASNGSAEQ